MSQQLLEFKIETLAEIHGGKLKAAFEHEIRRAVHDCEDRSTDKAEREVSLTIKFYPLVDEKGFLEQVIGNFCIKSKVPKRQTNAISFKVRKGAKGPMLVWNEDSPGNVDQNTLLPPSE